MTEIVWDGKKVKKLEIHSTGEDGEHIWFRGPFEDDTTEESYLLRGGT